jgi:hypothetical protein
MSEEDESNRLKKEFRDSFSNRLSYDGQVVSDDQVLEARQISDFFLGKKWEEITLDALQNDYIGDPSACFSFMTDEAKKYYFPAYVIASLTNYYEADLIVDSTVYLLNPENWENRKEFSLWSNAFSKKQKKLIRDYLLYLRKYYSSDFENKDGSKLDVIINLWGKSETKRL